MRDISYLALYGNSNGVPSEQEQQTQALFVLNIIFGVGTIVMDLLVLCVRRGVLAELKDTNPEEEAGKEKSTTELADVYKGKDEEEGVDGGIERMANPMHSVAMSQMREDIVQLRGENARLKERLRQHGTTEDGVDSEMEEMAATMTVPQ